MNPQKEFTKMCTKCRAMKSYNDFRKDSHTKDGLTHNCKVCKRSYDHQRFLNNRDQRLEMHRKWKLMNRHGITLEEKQKMIENQFGKCAICQKILVSGGSTHIDHNHKTGENRGILCNQCNRGIGYLQDNPIITQAATNYLLTGIANPVIV